MCPTGIIRLVHQLQTQLRVTRIKKKTKKTPGLSETLLLCFVCAGKNLRSAITQLVSPFGRYHNYLNNRSGVELEMGKQGYKHNPPLLPIIPISCFNSCNIHRCPRKTNAKLTKKKKKCPHKKTKAKPSSSLLCQKDGHDPPGIKKKTQITQMARRV